MKPQNGPCELSSRWCPLSLGSRHKKNERDVYSSWFSGWCLRWKFPKVVWMIFVVKGLIERFFCELWPWQVYWLKERWTHTCLVLGGFNTPQKELANCTINCSLNELATLCSSPYYSRFSNTSGWLFLPQWWKWKKGPKISFLKMSVKFPLKHYYGRMDTRRISIFEASDCVCFEPFLTVASRNTGCVYQPWSSGLVYQSISIRPWWRDIAAHRQQNPYFKWLFSRDRSCPS